MLKSIIYIYIYIYEMSSNYMWCNLIRVARFFNRSSLFDLTVNNHFLPVINKSKLFFIHKNSLLSLSLSLSLPVLSLPLHHLLYLLSISISTLPCNSLRCCHSFASYMNIIIKRFKTQKSAFKHFGQLFR